LKLSKDVKDGVLPGQRGFHSLWSEFFPGLMTCPHVLMPRMKIIKWLHANSIYCFKFIKFLHMPWFQVHTGHTSADPLDCHPCHRACLGGDGKQEESDRGVLHVPCESP
jgi:ferric iron reductase protein FhuF